MVDNKQRKLDDIFHALSDSTRRAMMSRLAHGECNVSELPNPYRVSKAAISKHLSVLARAELVKKEKDGRTTLCAANPESLNPALHLLEELGQFWRGRLESLDQFFNESLKKETNHDKSKTGNKKSSKSKT